MIIEFFCKLVSTHAHGMIPGRFWNWVHRYDQFGEVRHAAIPNGSISAPNPAFVFLSATRRADLLPVATLTDSVKCNARPLPSARAGL